MALPQPVPPLDPKSSKEFLDRLGKAELTQAQRNQYRHLKDFMKDD